MFGTLVDVEVQTHIVSLFILLFMLAEAVGQPFDSTSGDVDRFGTKGGRKKMLRALYNKQYPCPNQSKKYLQLLYSDDVLNRAESIKDYWNLKHGQGPKKKSNQEKNHQKK